MGQPAELQKWLGGFGCVQKMLRLLTLQVMGKDTVYTVSCPGKVNVKILDGSFEIWRSHPTWDGPKTHVNTNGSGDKKLRTSTGEHRISCGIHVECLRCFSIPPGRYCCHVGNFKTTQKTYEQSRQQHKGRRNNTSIYSIDILLSHFFLCLAIFFPSFFGGFLGRPWTLRRCFLKAEQMGAFFIATSVWS